MSNLLENFKICHVRYHFEDVEIHSFFSQEKEISAWLQQVADKENLALESIDYIFCSDEYLLKINLEYLQHDTYTDVITFPYSDKHIEGDIFISLERIADNADSLGLTFEQEVRRVMAHGLLHLCGYTDKSPSDKENMTRLEDEALALWR